LGHIKFDDYYPAIEALVENGEGVAAFVCDGIFDSQGALVTPN